MIDVVVFFFLLGVFARVVKSDLRLPEVLRFARGFGALPVLQAGLGIDVAGQHSLLAAHVEALDGQLPL